jgi:hypothetical protein
MSGRSASGGWWRRWTAAPVVRGRTGGLPPSANGASSFHLGWEPAPGPAVAAAVTLEVLEPPAVDRLYFWALQVDWIDEAGRRAGGAHLGLQWYPPHPGATAVNWGGYDATGRELDGSASALPSATGNPNTRDLAWRPGAPYRLAVRRAPLERRPDERRWAWEGSVTGPDGVTVVVRDLWPAGSLVAGVTMWSEVFARCDDPPVAVRWSSPERRLADGSADHPAACRVNYQTHSDGGCANTDSSADGVGLVQRTSTARRTPPGARLRVPAAGAAGRAPADGPSA